MTTLRVWERRYGVVAAEKTETGHRVYSPHDVARLRLLRQLTHAGHAIGTIATLELEPLQALVRGMPLEPVEVGSDARATVVVGRSAAHAFEEAGGGVPDAVHDDLDSAEAAPLPAQPIGLLLVRLASLQPRDVDRVLALGTALRAEATLVVYAFGTEASAGFLRESGVTVQREPIAGRKLMQWVRDARSAARETARAAAEAAWQVEPRRFSDETLARLAETPSNVACECLRHMAEIVAQLAGFERYSQDCTATGPADAELHRHLTRTAGAARTMFEQALLRVKPDERG